jgi:hypothetical protein
MGHIIAGQPAAADQPGELDPSASNTPDMPDTKQPGIAPSHTGLELSGAQPPASKVVFDDDSVGDEDFESLGALLVYLRSTFFERVQSSTAGLAHPTLTAQAVADCLSAHRYSMTSGSYSLLEQGKTLPKNPELFMESICKCLGVSASSKYWLLLPNQYMYDHARRYLGAQFESFESHFPHGRRLLDLLRSGVL